MNQLKTVLLLGVLTTLLVVFGSAVSPGNAYVFLVLGIVMNVGAYFFSDKLVLKMQGARETTPEESPGLHRLIEELSMKAGIPKPRIYIIEAPYANAFATGRNPKNGAVAFTRGILKSLSERELRGVAAHELSHIKHRDILIATIAATVASTISALADVIKWGAIFGAGRGDDREGGNPAYLLALAVIAPIIALLLQLAVSRAREFAADSGAADLTGDPESLASALKRLESYASHNPIFSGSPATASLYIVNPMAGFGSVMMNLFSTHPPMAKRIEALMQWRRS